MRKPSKPFLLFKDWCSVLEDGGKPLVDKFRPTFDLAFCLVCLRHCFYFIYNQPCGRSRRMAQQREGEYVLILNKESTRSL